MTLNGTSQLGGGRLNTFYGVQAAMIKGRATLYGHAVVGATERLDYMHARIRPSTPTHSRTR